MSIGGYVTDSLKFTDLSIYPMSQPQTLQLVARSRWYGFRDRVQTLLRDRHQHRRG